MNNTQENKHFTVHVVRESEKFSEWFDVFAFVPTKEDAIKQAEEVCKEKWHPFKDMKTTITLLEGQAA